MKLRANKLFCLRASAAPASSGGPHTLLRGIFAAKSVAKSISSATLRCIFLLAELAKKRNHRRTSLTQQCCSMVMEKPRQSGRPRFHLKMQP